MYLFDWPHGFWRNRLAQEMQLGFLGNEKYFMNNLIGNGWNDSNVIYVTK